MKFVVSCLLLLACISGGCSWMGRTAGKAHAKIERKTEAVKEGYEEGYTEEKSK